ncbi:MAG TPA: PPC domain-containing protein, partial [Pirellulaceae bacterium]|nr:PPC domain-containing protein [Pirellulaceae bacterium]
MAGETFLFDPVVAYDESLDRWIVAALSAADGNATESDLLYAVSNSDDPTSGWAEQHRIDFHGASPGYFADYPKIGWNADSHVFTFNMFGLTGVHVDVLAIDKTSVIDGNSATFAARISTRMRNDFTMAAATMHDATPGGPMWFVQENSYGDGEFIRLVRMDRVNSDSPRFTDFTVRVAGYSATPSAVQPGGTFTTNDSRMLNAELRDGRLVATHTVGLAGDATARWYEFDVSTGVPTLKQQGNIRPGPGVSTYYPSIAINAAGDIGMTYMQSAADEFVSMYVTGQKAGGPSGVMGAPALVKAGDTTYPGRRGGDYSGTTVDPVTDAFWSANEVVLNGALWSTWIASFNVEQVVDKDIYVLNATAGDQLSIHTTTPFDAPLLIDNSLDPRLELIGPSGSVVAVDDNSSGDGRNAAISFTATQTGSHRLRVSGAVGTAGASGEYLLTATGMSGTTAGPVVVSSQPIDGLKTKALPKTYELEFSTQLLATSIDPQDLVVGGRPALAARLLDGRRLQFTLDPATHAGDGVYPVTIAAGALTDLAGRGNSAYSASLTIDATGPHVIATTWNGASLAADKVLPVGGVDFTAKFDEPLMALRSARRGLKLPGVDDVSLTNRTTGEVTRPQAVDYDFANAIFSARFATLAEGPYRLRLASNGDAFADQVG